MLALAHMVGQGGVVCLVRGRARLGMGMAGGRRAAGTIGLDHWERGAFLDKDHQFLLFVSGNQGFPPQIWPQKSFNNYLFVLRTSETLANDVRVPCKNELTALHYSIPLLLQ